MSRRYRGSTSNYHSSAVTPVINTPFTFLAWVLTGTDVSTEQCVICITNNVNSDGNLWAMELLSGTVIALVGVLNNFAFSSSPSSLIATRWNHCAAVMASDTSRTAYVNGAAGSANTTNLNPTNNGVDTTAIGVLRLRSIGTPLIVNPLLGASVAEVAVIPAALSAADIQRLYNAGVPWNVGRGAAARGWWATMGIPMPVAYWPGFQRSQAPQVDLTGLYSLDQVGDVPWNDQPPNLRRFPWWSGLGRVAAAASRTNRLTYLGVS